jgi:hypothetical protein
MRRSKRRPPEQQPESVFDALEQLGMLGVKGVRLVLEHKVREVAGRELTSEQRRKVASAAAATKLAATVVEEVLSGARKGRV